MKRIIITLALVLVLATPAHAGEWFSWDETNTALHVPLTALIIVDMWQTLWIADNCQPIRYKGKYYDKAHWRWVYYDYTDEPCYERYNTHLGKYPDSGDVYTYFAVSYAFTSFIAWALPERFSHAFQGGVISLEAYMVENNYSLGIGVKF